MFAFSLVGIIIALALLIPLSVVIGQWARGGPVTVACIGAALGFALFWVILSTSYSLTPPSFEASLFATLLGYVGGALLTLAAWALALADAIRARRWGWLAAVWLAVYVTIAATYSIFATPIVSCAFSTYPNNCAPQSRIFFWLIAAGSFVGPAVLLTYALRHATRAQPDGLSVSPLDGADTVRVEPL